MKYAAFFVLFILGVSCATTIDVISPIKKTVSDGDFVELGRIGPGQTVYIAVEPKVTTGGIHGIGGLWDQMVIPSLPRGWSGKDSKIDEDPLQIEITAPPNAENGRYAVTVSVVDEGDAEKLGGSVTFNLFIDIDDNVMDMYVSPETASVGAGQPARYSITVANTGAADDVFKISSSGVKGWMFSKSIYVSSGSAKQITYEVVGEEEETYSFYITATSASSNLIQESKGVKMIVKTNLPSDYKGTTHGLLMFPVIELPIYAVAGLISNLF
jgi:hypothetical protein